MAFEQIFTILSATGLGAAMVLLFVRPRQSSSMTAIGSFEPIQTTSTPKVPSFMDIFPAAQKESAAAQAASPARKVASASHTKPFSMTVWLQTLPISITEPAKAEMMQACSGQKGGRPRRSTTSGRTRTRAKKSPT